ncbi:hypothetical protein SAMN05216327_102282 [Dyadobacter sp. SG02]|uniref:hypothetical protein n=1 Tax=Dyadobacter sp. SG02 TaxID=1855291 RepID=UPI0008D13728|nr:hypothetical protein [Dyadobacter sp. SG02]SEI53325.1 hypothetical protein SAMN05216327_102282 [Dyadobacter sp. SG02]
MGPLSSGKFSKKDESRLRSKFGTVYTLTLATLTCALGLSCENSRPADPLDQRQVKVIDLNRDTVIAVANENRAETARISFVETLSDTALVKVSNDTLFSQHGMGFLLPITKPMLTSIGGLTGDSLYVKYQPLKTPITGALTVEITYSR